MIRLARIVFTTVVIGWGLHGPSAAQSVVRLSRCQTVAPTIRGSTLPSFAVTTLDDVLHVYSTATVNDAILVSATTSHGGGRWTLSITQAKVALKDVYFPWQIARTPLDSDLANDLYYYPFLLGQTEKASNHDVDFTWAGYVYPAMATAPLVVMADPTSAQIVAATNWPPKTVTPFYAAQRLVLRYSANLPVDGAATYGALIATVDGTEAAGNIPWQNALDLYATWLRSVRGPVSYPSWMWDGQGLQDIQLQDFVTVAAVDSAWQSKKALYPWLLLWGQMSPQGGGCCGIDPNTSQYYADPKTFDSRWTSDGLPAWTAGIASGFHAGYYTAPFLPNVGTPSGAPASGALDTPGGLAWLTGWIALNASLGANAPYLDVLARDFFGDPAVILARFADGTLPRAALAEGVSDIYPVPGLVSGALAGGGLCGAPYRRPTDVTLTTYPPFVRYLLADRLIYWGWENDDRQFWGVGAHTGCDYATYCTAGLCDYGVERQLFLTGARISLGVGASNATVDAIVAERQRVNWWPRRLRYLGTKGLNLTTLAPSSHVEVARFQDEQCHDVLAISNPDLVTGLSFSMSGVRVAVPVQSIAIVP